MAASPPSAHPWPRVLLLGGVDPCGGAGITADARTLLRHDCEALAIPTAWTVQNRHGMQGFTAVPPAALAAMLAAALDDGPVHAVKTGLLVDQQQVELLAGRLVGLVARVPLVVDPVLSATAGGYTAAASLAAALVRSLLPLAAVVTPNLPELQALAGGRPERLLATGCRAVLVKGGHGDGVEVHDELHTAAGTTRSVHARLPTGPVHGTGCAFATTLAARLALGDELPAAAATASAFLSDCLREMGGPDASGRPRPLRLSCRTSR